MAKQYTDSELLDILNNAEQKSTRFFDTKGNGLPSSSTYKKRFGSWKNAQILANVPLGKSATDNKYTSEELLDILRKTNTRTEAYFDTKDNGLPSVNTYINRFGSWVKAQELAGLIPTNIRGDIIYYTDEELLDILRNSDTKTVMHFRDNKDLPHSIIYERRFGSWNNALDLAGCLHNKGGIDPTKSTTVYLVDFGEYYKIGITQRDIKVRFYGYPKYSVVFILENLSLQDALNIEKEWIHNVRDYKYEPINLIAGHTECFKY